LKLSSRRTRENRNSERILGPKIVTYDLSEKALETKKQKASLAMKEISKLSSRIESLTKDIE
jgi:hypothetical protein